MLLIDIYGNFTGWILANTNKLLPDFDVRFEVTRINLIYK
jgi:hypothetical protein